MWKKAKSGAASFYIVAISTLVLVIIATSFAAVIISEINRTANDDLAQSAYDSALAGIEDAKLAYYNYVKCVNGVMDSGCDKIIGLVEGASTNCSMVKEILGRDGEGTEVRVEEGKDNDMDQAYTCATLSPVTKDYVVTISGSTMHTAKVKLANSAAANDIKSIIVSWGVKKDDGSLGIPNGEGQLLEVGVVQTAENYDLDQFRMTTVDGKTNRGTVFLKATSGKNDKTMNNHNRTELKKMLLKSNDKTVENGGLKNEPYAINCSENVSSTQGGYACVTQIDLPDPVPDSDGNGERSNDTFYVTLAGINVNALDVKLEFCTTDTDCMTGEDVEINGGKEWAYYSDSEKTASLNMQIKVDSTGRANDLYRRVETRLGANGGDGGSGSGLGLDFAVQADKIEKIDAVTCEQNFGANNCV